MSAHIRILAKPSGAGACGSQLRQKAPAGRGCRCSARASTSTRRSSTTPRAARWRRRRSSIALRKSLKTGADKAAAAAVGKLVAERAKAAGVTEVVFDRGAYLYHGRVKALADAAREGGLDF